MFAKLSIAENNRVLLTRNNRFARLLTPGVHRVFTPPLLRIGTEWHDVRSPLFNSKWAPFLLQERPDLVAEHFILAKTGSLDLAMITVNGALYDVILPEKTVLFWKAAGRTQTTGCSRQPAAVKWAATKLPPITHQVFF